MQACHTREHVKYVLNLIAVDDLGFHDLSFTQSGGLESKVNTPTLSQLARESILLGTDYCKDNVLPRCHDSRACLFHHLVFFLAVAGMQFCLRRQSHLHAYKNESGQLHVPTQRWPESW